MDAEAVGRDSLLLDSGRHIADAIDFAVGLSGIKKNRRSRREGRAVAFRARTKQSKLALSFAATGERGHDPLVCFSRVLVRSSNPGAGPLSWPTASDTFVLLVRPLQLHVIAVYRLEV